MAQSPAIPTFILRGHTSPVHALLFLAANTHLASGDSDGWLVIWSVASKRPVAVWKAHAGGIAGMKSWGQTRLITHGRDHKLRIWKLALAEHTLSKTLPVEGARDDQPQPWLVHSIDMSALNFCDFATCEEPADMAVQGEAGILIASPNALDNGGVDVFQLPREQRVSQMSSDKTLNTGMVMSVALYNDSGTFHLICGYEDGQVAIHRHQGGFDQGRPQWKRDSLLKLHSQPVLSLAMSPFRDFFLTSSADAKIVRTAFNPTTTDASNASRKSIDTKHAGQQGLSIRSDGRIFATAGWDARVRVYSAKTLKELAVLKWHKEGCYSTAFADVDSPSDSAVVADNGEHALIRSALDIIRQERNAKAQTTHWLAAGGKDGKISLWNIY